MEIIPYDILLLIANGVTHQIRSWKQFLNEKASVLGPYVFILLENDMQCNTPTSK
jgi:hypothetical protein